MHHSASRLLVAVAATAANLMLAHLADATVPPKFIPARMVRPGVIPVKADGIMVEQAWARASAGNATTGAAYATVMGGSEPDRLVGVSTPVAATAEVHESFTDNGVMKMRAVTALPIPAGKSVTFSPGGYHVMLTGLKKPLVAGESFPLTFRFEHKPPVTVDVPIRPIGRDTPGVGPTSDEDHMHMQ
jgi:periplasmic copper chaperone A